MKSSALQSFIEPPDDDPAPDESLADRAYRLIEEMIVTLGIPPGGSLTESRLVGLLGIGRTPVREALLRLAHDNLVEILPRRGIRVTQVDVKRQLQLLGLRREIERLIAAQAARHATRGERLVFAEMANSMTRTVEDGDHVGFLRIDRAFNQFSAECARNPFAARAIAPLHALSRRFWMLHFRETDEMRRTAKAHIEIMRAIAAGDPKQAAAATDALLDYVEDCTRSLDTGGVGRR